MKASRVEKERREKEIDTFDSEIERVRNLTAEMVTAANSIGDTELRSAAKKLCDHYARIIDLCSSIATAQRARSVWTDRFLNSLILGETLPNSETLKSADRQAEAGRAELKKIYPNEQLIYSEFTGIHERNKGFSVDFLRR